MEPTPEVQCAAEGKQAADKLLVLPEVLKRFPVAKSTWFNGVRNGKYPKPVRLSIRRVAWRESSIDELIASLQQGGEQ
jgi:predicted DNA-binding transcriptional regulator AlpA